MILKYVLVNNQKAGILIDTTLAVNLIWQMDRTNSFICIDLTFYFYDNKDMRKSCLSDPFQHQHSVTYPCLLLLIFPFSTYTTQSEFHKLVGLIFKMLNELISNTPFSPQIYGLFSVLNVMIITLRQWNRKI